MGIFKVGDVVARKKYGFDILFKIVDIKKDDADNEVADLKGITYRLMADAPESDLQLQPEERIKEETCCFAGNEEKQPAGYGGNGEDCRKAGSFMRRFFHSHNG